MKEGWGLGKREGWSGCGRFLAVGLLAGVLGGCSYNYSEVIAKPPTLEGTTQNTPEQVFQCVKTRLIDRPYFYDNLSEGSTQTLVVKGMGIHAPVMLYVIAIDGKQVRGYANIGITIPDEVKGCM